MKTTGRSRKLVLIGLPLMLALAGLYVLFVALSPALVSVPFANTDAKTEQRLKSKPGEYGDRLFIPQINIDVAIVTGTDDSVLDKGAWHRHPENGDPIKGGNFVLSAHRFTMGYTPQQTRAKSPFFNIDRLQIGDQIFVDYQGARYGYKISRKYSVKPDATEIEAASKEPKLTLYSCTLEGSADGRDVIEATPLGKVDKIEAEN